MLCPDRGFSVAAILLFLLTSCQNGRSNKPPFELGQVFENHLTALQPENIAFMRPAGTLATHPGGRIICEIKVDPKHDSDLPTFMYVHVIHRGRKLAGVPLVPVRMERGQYVLSGRLKAPQRPGEYRLSVEAVYMLRLSGEGKESATQPTPVPIKGPIIRRPGPNVEVEQ